MGWSWQELMATPAEVVADVRTYLQKQALIAVERQRIQEVVNRNANE